MGPLTGLAFARATAAVAAFVAIVACRQNSERHKVDFERMRVQQRHGPYDASAAFPDSMAMRTPPRGTLAREEFQLADAVATGKVNGAFVTDVPAELATDSELRQVGERDFRIYCAVCHGVDLTNPNAAAQSPVGRNMRPPPPSLGTDSARALSAGQLFEIITNGRNRMPGYSWALPPAERWGVIAYLRSQGAGSGKSERLGAAAPDALRPTPRIRQPTPNSRRPTRRRR